MPGEKPAISMEQAVGRTLQTLRRWAATKQYGEIRLVVKGGQIVVLHEDITVTAEQFEREARDGAKRPSG